MPDGAYPLFLTATTQTNFKCREREECTSVQPYVFVSKKFFLDDIQFRGVISDFHPTKKFIEKYPDDTDVQEDGTSGLLIVWDEEEDYGQNFYLVHKVRALRADTARALGAGDCRAVGSGAGADRAWITESSRCCRAPTSRPIGRLKTAKPLRPTRCAFWDGRMHVWPGAGEAARRF